MLSRQFVIKTNIQGGIFETLVDRPDPCSPEVHQKVHTSHCGKCGQLVNGGAKIEREPGCANQHGQFWWVQGNQFCPHCGRERPESRGLEAFTGSGARAPAA
jgi:hypothetical protein